MFRDLFSYFEYVGRTNDVMLPMLPSLIYSKLELSKVQRYEILFIYKDVISVCFFVCPIITKKSLDRFASNLDLGTR